MHERQVATALNYAAEHPDEIDGRIAANEHCVIVTENASDFAHVMYESSGYVATARYNDNRYPKRRHL